MATCWADTYILANGAVGVVGQSVSLLVRLHLSSRLLTLLPLFFTFHCGLPSDLYNILYRGNHVCSDSAQRIAFRSCTHSQSRAMWSSMSIRYTYAFTTPAPISSSRYATASRLTRRRPASKPSPPRRRRPSHAVHAVFIWSSEYEDDQSEDPEDTESDPQTDNDSAFDDSVWGDAWRKTKSSADDTSSSADDDDPADGPSFDEISAEEEKLKVKAGDADPPNKLYVSLREQTTGPDDVERLRSLASGNATDAFRRIVMGILGTIPSDTYEVVVTSDRGGLSRLMHSSLCTGYALRNAEFRMSLNECMSADTGNVDTVHIGEGKTVADMRQDGESKSEPDYMRDVPRREKVDTSALGGMVRWWDGKGQAKRELGGAEYVARLEAENELLRERLAATRLHDSSNNKLMDFMRTLNAEKITGLQSNLSEDAVDTFKRVIKSVLGELSADKVQMTYSTSRDYLAQMTFWCLLVGYSVRNMEKRMEMTRIFEETEAFVEPSVRDGDS